MTVKHSERPGYTTAEDKREFLQLTLAGWTFKCKPVRHHGAYSRSAWFITGPCKTYFNGPYPTRRAAVRYVIGLLEGTNAEGETSDVS